jgi:cobalamin biosynthesis protein CobD/CbiB
MIALDQWLNSSLPVDLSRLTGPTSLIVFILLIDGLSRLVPAIRDHLRPLLGIPYNVFAGLQQRLARPSRSSNDLKRRGVLAVAILALVGVSLAVAGVQISLLNYYAAYVVWFLVWRWSVGWTLARDILALEKPTARDLKNHLARRQIKLSTPLADTADAATVYRVTIEVLALTLVHGLFAPLIYALIVAACGYPAFYGAVLGVMGAALAENDPVDATQRQFQTVAQPLAAGILFLPSRLAGILMLLAALFTPKAKILKGFTMMLGQGHRYPFFSLGWAIALISGVFGIAFPLQNAKQEWLGDKNATARIEKGMLQRVLWLHVVTVLLTALILCAVLLLSIK